MSVRHSTDRMAAKVREAPKISKSDTKLWTFRVNAKLVAVPAGALYTDLRVAVASEFHFALESVKLLCRGKLLRDDADVAEAARMGSALMALGSTTEAVESVRRARVDPLLRPFAEDLEAEKTAIAGRYAARPYVHRPVHLLQSYGFGALEVLEGFSDKAAALAILERLSTEPGFLYVLRQRQWRVGKLCEMAPDGRVNVDPVCVLGVNCNRGESIHLRLRTDDLAGFRRYDSVREVLAHELAHNAIAEHTSEFYRLMGTILREANHHDWRRRGGHRLSDAKR